MNRISRLVPMVVAVAASMLVTSSADAQGYLSIIDCSVNSEEIFLAPGESATFNLSVDGDGEWAWTTIVVDGVVTVDGAQRTSDIGVEFSYDLLAADVEDSVTQTWWAVDVGGDKVGDPLCTATVSLASAEIPVVGSTVLPVVAAATMLVLLGALLMVMRRRTAARD